MHRRYWWFAWLALSACTQLVDFDRSKIPDGDGSTGDGGGSDGADGSMDAGGDGTPDDAGTDAGRDAGTTCDLTSHAGCGDAQLCCDFADGAGANCIDVTPTQCTACNAEATPTAGACDPNTASTCGARACECTPGSGTACSGDTPFCVQEACVACRGDEDCTTAGKGQCVAGQCVACDFADGQTGCANPTPICLADNSCVGCDGTNACPSPLSCDNGSCFGCVVGSNQGCSGATPICEETSSGSGQFQCVGCANDGQCGDDECVPVTGGGACEVCDPRDGQGNAGCSDAAKPICNGTPLACVACDAVSSSQNERDAACADESSGTICAADGRCRLCDTSNDYGCSAPRGQCKGGTECVECLGNGDCSGAQVCDTSTNDCVQCLSDAQCGGATPLCNTATHSCVACTAVDNTTGNTRCGAIQSGSVCVSTGASAGRCGTCDPADDNGCSGTNDQCSATLMCVDCIGGAGCASGQVCLSGGNTCVECNDSNDCGNNEVCDTSSHTCVQCLSDAQCSGASPLCNTTTHACVPCTSVSNGAANTRCDAITDGSVCVSTGASAGRCGTCDPSDDDGCSGTNDQCATNLTCVDCIGADGCDSGVCLTGGNQCVECNGNGDCSNGEVCNTTTHACVECTSDAQCSGATPLCNTSTNQCVACTALTEATANARCSAITSGAVCVSSGGSSGRCGNCDPTDDDGCSGTNDQCASNLSCVDCIGAAGCTTGVCVTGGNSCVECNQTSDCTNGELCDVANNTCVECLDAGDCSAGQGCVNGACGACAGDATCTGSSVGTQCVGLVGAACRACDPGLLPDDSDDQGCMAGQTCNLATFVCE